MPSTPETAPTPPSPRAAAPEIEFPPFEPARWLRNGHLQTLAGAFWAESTALRTPTQRHWVELPDGDQLALHDNTPPGWRTGGPAALLVHGLAGCHASRYLVRMTGKLNERGVRVFRVDLRGCGAGFNRARLPYHAGRWEDIAATVSTIGALTAGGDLAVAGFSLGGSLVLNWLGRLPEVHAPRISRAMAINPPVDLTVSTEAIGRAARGFYDRYFARTLYHHIRGSLQWDPGSPLAKQRRVPTRLAEFDELFTAPLCGFSTAADYYALASAARVVPQIHTPTLILSAADDPLIPVATLESLDLPPAVQLHLAPGGGHLGYLAGTTTDPDRHWLDWRVVDWLAAP